MLEPEEAKVQLLREVCQGEPDDTFLAIVDILWDSNWDRQGDLQYLYTKRALLDVRLAQEQASVDYAIGTDMAPMASQLYAHVQQMRTDCQAEIVRVTEMLQANRGGASGTIVKTEPLLPPFSGPDANDIRYRGSVYDRLRRNG